MIMVIYSVDPGESDVGVSWRMANYGEGDIIGTVDALYDEILPLYQQLHAFVRHKLVQYYNEENLDPDGPIPAHILGNITDGPIPAHILGNITDSPIPAHI